MSKTAFIFPGQGAQKAGMGKDFYGQFESARQIYDQASQWLGLDMKALCFEQNDRLDLTEYTQAAMVTTCLAMEKVVTEQGLFPDVTAGLSLGEYCAVAAAGGMSVKDAVTIARTRGILMEQAVPAGIGAMAAVLGMDAQIIERITASIDGVGIANYNCPGQIVISGKKESVLLAAQRLKDAGAKRTVPLNVSGPFHSPMLVEAGRKLGKVLEKAEFRSLKVPYVTNVTAEYVYDIGKTKQLLERQISSPVCWQQSMERMIREGVDTFVEIGPGKTLGGFLRKIDRSVQVYHIQAVEDLREVICAVKSI